MQSTTLSTPVESPRSEHLHLYRCCVECLTEWPRLAAPARCPDCGGRIFAGRLHAAFRRIDLNNGY